MPTKLSRYCEGIMEAAWLAAVILVPVFFNIYSGRIFEPDKITLLRSLALVILAVWAIKLIEEGGFRWDVFKPKMASWRDFLRTPLLLPALALAGILLLSTFFSVTPRTSLWGSYQRLQGTYTTFSYLVVFGSMAVNLRRKAQVERLISAVIIASLPVSLYGILQRFKLDPIPWGGDVSSRIAANMGNSIFVGAYLIMAFPLLVMRIVESFEALLNSGEKIGPNFSRATGYVFIAALQAVALYFSSSRGPWLGWSASLVFIWLGLSLIWRKRRLTLTGVGIALAAAVFLVVLNLPNSPLSALRSVPGLGRLGQLLDPESRTGKVRTLIWEGVVELVSPHPPLQFPDGRQDSLNFLRPLVGYGPESMYVAYSPFYPPELTQVEKRNATPDRSHNETWDSLVITGVFGLLAYLALFGAVIYFGLKWLGLVRGTPQRNLFIGLCLAGGAISTASFVILKGWGYSGVALPFGIILGVIIYLILAASTGKYQAPQSSDEKLRAYLLLGLLAAVVAHFVEVNFGIAIAVTRTYFWVYAALLLLVGTILPKLGEYKLSDAQGAASGDNSTNRDQSQAHLQAGATKQHLRDAKIGSKHSNKKRKFAKTSQAESALAVSPWLRQAVIMGLVMAVLMTSLGYDFVSNTQRLDSVSGAFWNSLIAGPKGAGPSYGILALFLTTLVVDSILLGSESLAQMPRGTGKSHVSQPNWGRMISLILGMALLLALVFWLWHETSLVTLVRNPATSMAGVIDQVERTEHLLSRAYFYLFFLLFLAGVWLPETWPAATSRMQFGSWAAALIIILLALFLVSATNVRVVQADIAFKSAEVFARGDTWPVSIQIYNRAIDLAPNEDYYYLFLGRAYLEYARSLGDEAQREKLISQAAADLRKAQQINPLNTDHTANLARLHSLWATFTSDPTLREERARISENYFSKAVLLSPNNARIWGEWASLYLNVLNQLEEARLKLDRALEIDPYYDWTYGLLGDYYSRYAESMSDPPAQKAALENAILAYRKALELAGFTPGVLAYNYAVMLGGAHTQLEQYPEALAVYEQARQLLPNQGELFRLELAIARTYAQMGDQANALAHALKALEAAPPDQLEGVRAAIAEMGLVIPP